MSIFGCPRKIVIDNAQAFKSIRMMESFPRLQY